MKVDSGMALAHLDRDSDFRDHVRVYLHRFTGEFVSVYEDDECHESVMAGAELNAEARLEVESDPAGFVEIPVPDHVLIHQWFREFLESEDRAYEYSGSIGRWLYSHNDKHRHAWSNFRGDRVCDLLTKTAEVAGVTLELC